MVKKLNCYKYGERGKELKVPYYASAAAARDGNLPYIKATCLTLRQLALNNGHLPLFPTKTDYKNLIGFLTTKKLN